MTETGQEMGTVIKTPKTKKGEISLSQTGGTIRLRWRHNGNRYTLSPHLPCTFSGLKQAEILSKEIQLEISKGIFDTTLEKYRIDSENETPHSVKQKAEVRPETT
jgi:integrase